MRLVSNKFQTILEFQENQIQSLVIESPDVFREVIMDFVSGINGMESGIVLSEDNAPIKISNGIELISSFVPFEANTKKLISGLLKSLENEAMDEQHYMNTQQLLADIEQYMEELTFHMPGSLEYNINLAGLLKMTSPKLSLDELGGIEVIYEYMMFYREVVGERIFVLVNLREYYNQKDVEDFAHTVLQHKFRVLLIDNKEYPILDEEHRLIIDNDHCEI